VAEGFIRTLKEQVIYGRIFYNLQEVQDAVRRLVDTCNREWRVEKNGYQSPGQARAHWLAQNAAMAA